MFSIIIPLFNKEKDILKTIESVLNQSYTEFEIIVIDDGSSDNSLKIVNQIIDARITVYSKENEGVSSARNFGVEKACFNFIAFLDGDDLWDNNYLLEIYKAILKFDNYLVFATNYKIQFSADRFYKPIFVPKNNSNDFLIVKDYFYYSKINSILTGSSIVIHKEIINKIGLFDVNLTHGEDLDYWFRISKYFEIIFVNKYLMTYRYNSSNRSIAVIPVLTKSVISKYELSGKVNFDNVLSKIASRFAINYLLNNRKSDAMYCLKKIKKPSLSYYLTFIFLCTPYVLRRCFFSIYMSLRGHNV